MRVAPTFNLSSAATTNVVIYRDPESTTSWVPRTGCRRRPISALLTPSLNLFVVSPGPGTLPESSLENSGDLIFECTRSQTFVYPI